MATLWAVAHCFQLKSNSEYNYENTIKKNIETKRNKKGNEQERRTTMHKRDNI